DTGVGPGRGGQIVLAATVENNGLFRSTDGGITWTQISGSDGSHDGIDNNGDGRIDEAGELDLPAGGVRDVQADPGNNLRFYAALPAQFDNKGVLTQPGGVFRSEDGGLTWRTVSNGVAGIANAVMVKLAV